MKQVYIDKAKGIYSEDYCYFLTKSIKARENGVSWQTLCDSYAREFGEKIAVDALRKRVKHYAKHNNINYHPTDYNHKSFTVTSTSPNETYMQYNADGSVESSRIIDCADELIKTPNDLLRYLGYDENEWEVINFRVSRWEGGKDGEERTAVRYKIKPKSEISTIDYLKAAQEAFKEEIKSFKLGLPNTMEGLDKKKLMEIAPVELHLGKMANDIEVGENYDYKIAQKRFHYIFDEIVKKQQIEKCGRCVLIIGSDFFNSESDGCTSKDKIPQQNDTRYIKLFIEGIKMYKSAILTLRELFYDVDVMLCAGNHARAMETFLYLALQQGFEGDDVVHFIENYHLTQVYQFGKCAIFYNHGDANLKMTIKSIPAEFAEVWGTHPYRELHLGHLHKEVTVDDEGGMITRRIGSPCGTDAWHYGNRFIGTVKKHQIFVWDFDNGLKALHYIPINN